MKSILPNDITSVEDVKNFFEELAKNDELFHPEDPADGIYLLGSEERMFSEEEAHKIDSLIIQCYAHTEHPCQYAYDAMIKYMQVDKTNSL